MMILSRDLRHVIRVLLKSPGFAIVVVLTLALGIGANTALFSVVNGVLLNPLPYPKPDQIVTLFQKTPDFSEGSISYPNFQDWVRLNRAFSALAAYGPAGFNFTGRGEPRLITAMEVSATFFPLLGVNPVVGRNFSMREDETNGAPAVILSEGFWKREFGASPDIIGKALNLNGADYIVVGVLPKTSTSVAGRPASV